MVRVSGSITSPAGDTPTLLIQLAEECGPRERIDAMFTGNTINDTEGRAVLHVALRTRQEASIAAVAWDVVQTLVAAEFSQQERHLRRLAKVVTREQQGVADGYNRSR